MKLQTVLVLLIVAIVAAFAALNWDTFVASTGLSLGFTTVQVPLGLVMLGLLAAVVVFFLAFAVILQVSARREARRQAQELRAARELAEKAEASRYTKLHDFLKAELKKEENLNAESTTAVLARLEQAVRDLQILIEQSGNTLAAYIGEVEDRLEKQETPAASAVAETDRNNNC